MDPAAITKDRWVWIIVQNPGKNEELLGQYDDSGGIAFIPAFLEKEAAQQCLPRMTKEHNRTYEVQAMLFEDLYRQAAENGFKVFILDGGGGILHRIEP